MSANLLKAESDICAMFYMLTIHGSSMYGSYKYHFFLNAPQTLPDAFKTFLTS